jgi:hypothetical protein
MRSLVRNLGILACGAMFTVGAYGQSANLTDNAPAANPAPVQSTNSTPSKHADMFGLGVKVSLLGAGVEGAVRVTQRTNVRAGFNMFSYSRGFNKDGVAYNGQLSFKSVEAHYDIFPFKGGFHLSPGVLVYAGTPITATANVPAGQTFSLGGTQYYSDNPPNSLTGNGNIKFNRAAPMVTVGWGNLIPRRENKHFSIPFEIGVAFQGSPKATLGLAGNVCDSTPGTPNANCRSVASDPTVQANILSEQNKINNSMSFFKVYPIISTGIGYKF